MKILMSGSLERNRLTSWYAQTLQSLGCTVALHYGAYETRMTGIALVDRALRRLAERPLWHASNARLIRACEEFRPDIVWLFKGQDIYPETLRALRKLGPKLVAYNADHPFEFFSRGSGNRNVAEAITEYDLYFTYSQHIAKQMAERYPNVRTAVLPFGHDVDEGTFAEICNAGEIARLCFVGNPDRHRADKIATLAAAGLPIDVYGHGWARFGALTGAATLHGPVEGREMLRTLRRYRVQLNFLRPHNALSHNMRSFEIPACGGIMLAEDTVEHRAFFAGGEEAFYFSDDAAMIGLARRLLAMDRSQADAVRARARARSVNERYTYFARAQTALDRLKRLYDDA